MNARTVTPQEATAFEHSLDGLAWKVWQCVKEHHPEIDSLEAAKQLMVDAGEEHFEELARATEIASGESDVKKSSGQAEKVEAEAAPAGQ